MTSSKLQKNQVSYQVLYIEKGRTTNIQVTPPVWKIKYLGKKFVTDHWQKVCVINGKTSKSLIIVNFFIFKVYTTVITISKVTFCFGEGLNN